jgi:hypothetical protein
MVRGRKSSLIQSFTAVALSGFLLISLLTTAAVVPSGAAPAAVEEGDGPATDVAHNMSSTVSDEEADRTVTQHTTLTLEQNGTVTVTSRLTADPTLTDVAVEVSLQSAEIAPDGIRVVGFDTTTAGAAYSWQPNATQNHSEADQPSLTYTVPKDAVQYRAKNHTAFTASHQWHTIDLRADCRNVSLVRNTTIQGSGVVGDRVAYFGPVDTYTRSVDGVEYRLWVPSESADSLSKPPTQILNMLSSTGGSLGLHNYQDSASLLAIPAGEVPEEGIGMMWPTEGEGWVRADIPTDTYPSVWAHELAHASQSYQTAADAYWFLEGYAEYYGTTLPASYYNESDRINKSLTRSAGSVTLSDPETWPTRKVAYREGSVTVAALNARIKRATNHQKTVVDLNRYIARNHPKGDRLTNQQLIEYVGEVSNSKVENWTREETTSNLSLSKDTRSLSTPQPTPEKQPNNPKQDYSRSPPQDKPLLNQLWQCAARLFGFGGQ